MFATSDICLSVGKRANGGRSMKICFLADNRNRENWGCRATSIALKNIIQEKHEIISTVYGNITFAYDFTSYSGLRKIITLKDRILRKFHIREKTKQELMFLDSNFIRSDTESSLDNFLKVFEKYPPLRDLNKKL